MWSDLQNPVIQASTSTVQEVMGCKMILNGLQGLGEAFYFTLSHLKSTHIVSELLTT